MIHDASVTLLDPYGLWILTGPGLWLIIVTDDSGPAWGAETNKPPTGEAALRGLGLPIIAVNRLAARMCALAAHPGWPQLDREQRTLLCEPEAWALDAERWAHSCPRHPVRERVPARLPHVCAREHVCDASHGAPCLVVAAALRVRARPQGAVRARVAGRLPVPLDAGRAAPRRGRARGGEPR